ncbi:MAG: 2-phospho-L-lactate guanylyltransferase [Austwickia sp.]|nr:2-phospho-L-lactate guanylyltransferase [Austwickia sp.]
MTTSPRPAWTVVIPVKGGPRAKSRLVAQESWNRQELSRALALDTVAAAVASGVGPVLVVTADPLVADAVTDIGAEVADDPGAGLNAAARAGVAVAAGRHPHSAVAVLLGDLPALTAAELTAALTACADHEAAFVPDRSGQGTVLVTTAPGRPVACSFGPGSAQRHATSAFELALDLPRLRTDVDDPQDLRAALRLGVGPRTAAAVADSTTGQLEAS